MSLTRQLEGQNEAASDKNHPMNNNKLSRSTRRHRWGI